MRPRITKKGRVTEVRSERGRLGIAVELYRMGSGARVVERVPQAGWVQQMGQVKDLNYGEVTIVVRTTLSQGYDKENGVVMSLLPGKITGDVGDGTNQLHRGVQPVELPDFPSMTGSDDTLTIETSLKDAIALRDALTKIIREAHRLSAQVKKQVA